MNDSSNDPIASVLEGLSEISDRQQVRLEITMTNKRDAFLLDHRDDAERSGANIGSSPYRTDAHAVVIGINHYQDPAIRDLSYGRADAEAIYAVLTDPMFGRFNPENVQLLLDDEATRRRIWGAIGTQLPRRTSEEDTVYIYFAGHGAPVINPGAHSRDGLEKYLVPFDAELDDLRATGISMDDVQKLFGWIDCRQVIFFIDSCYSGGAGGRTLAQPGFQPRASLTDEFLDDLGGEGRCVVTACGVNEVSLEIPEFGHGLFTYYVVEGLKGAADTDEDGLVTMRELYDYVYKHVTEKARGLGGSMKPVQKGFVQGFVYLTRYETRLQKRARELDAEAASQLAAGSMDQACSLWEQVLSLIPEHDQAKQGLAKIKRKRLEEQRHRAETERKRQQLHETRQHELLGHYQAGTLPLSEYQRSMALLQKAPDEMTEPEKKLWSLLEPFADGRLSVSVYLSSVHLLDGDAVERPQQKRPKERSQEQEHWHQQPKETVESVEEPQPIHPSEHAPGLHEEKVHWRSPDLYVRSLLRVVLIGPLLGLAFAYFENLGWNTFSPQFAEPFIVGLPAGIGLGMGVVMALEISKLLLKIGLSMKILVFIMAALMFLLGGTGNELAPGDYVIGSDAIMMLFAVFGCTVGAFGAKAYERSSTAFRFLGGMSGAVLGAIVGLSILLLADNWGGRGSLELYWYCLLSGALPGILLSVMERFR